MKSAGQLEPAEADPFLFTRIAARLEKGPEIPVRYSVRRLALALAAVLIVNLGCFAARQRMNRQQAEEKAMASLGREMGFNKDMNY